MEENKEKIELKQVKELLKNHKGAFVVFCVWIVLFITALLLMLFAYINNSWVGRQGTATLGEFSIGTVLLFLVEIILWELIVIAIGLGILGAYVGYLWKLKLTEDEKAFIKSGDNKKSKLHKGGRGVGGAFSFFVGIAFLLIVYIDGHWVTPFNSLPYTYYVNAWFAGLFWVAIIIAIVGIVGGLAYYLSTKK
ncbi:MAG: hypothetical protein JW891_07515 [Candidatus Lokiarchaeota archaeon]|nr:hypothetical protein [Candidatus Lokiarchaeota archaeon]